MCLDSSIYKSSFCVKVLTPEDNYIYACSSAVQHVRKHVLHMMCPNPLTPTVGVSVSKKKKFTLRMGHKTRLLAVRMRH